MTNAANNGTNVIPLDDTREKLWTDCEDLIRRIQKRLFGGRDETALRCQFAELLDREKAITERECIDRWDAKATLEIAELRAKVNELTAELEVARKRHMENEDQLAEENDALIASVNELEADLNTAELDNEHLREELRRIEQLERDSAYMRLPVDADGVPIHLGDVVVAQDEQPFEVRAFQLDTLGWFAIERLGSQWNVNQLHHVQPDTVESLLEEYAQDKSEDWRIACNRYFREHCWSKDWLQDPEFSVVHCDNIAEYAERIRKAVEHGS